MLSVCIISVGKLREPHYISAFEEYIKRLSPYCKVTSIELTEKRLPDNPCPKEIEAALSAEAEAVIKSMPKGAYVIAMCVEGSTLTSEGFAAMIGNLAVSGQSKLCFIIGGSFGLHEQIKKRSSYRLSMSSMTLPHHLARVMLAEQIYRALMINENTKYHK